MKVNAYHSFIDLQYIYKAHLISLFGLTTLLLLESHREMYTINNTIYLIIFLFYIIPCPHLSAVFPLQIKFKGTVTKFELISMAHMIGNILLTLSERGGLFFGGKNSAPSIFM